MMTEENRLLAGGLSRPIWTSIFSVEIYDGCRLTWGWDGLRCFVRIDGNQHESFQVSEPDVLIYWQRPQ
jgi:hypothetical protein